MDLEALAATPRCESNTARIDEAQLNYEKHKEEFEKLRNDVEVKLKFLEENRVSDFFIFFSPCHNTDNLEL